MNGQLDIGDISPLKYFGVLAVVTGLLFGLIASEDSSPAGLVLQLLQWQLQALIPMLLLIAVQAALVRVSLPPPTRPWLRLALAGVLASIIFTPLGLALDVFIAGEAPPEQLVSELLDEFLGIAPPVTLFWMAANAPWVLGLRLQWAAAETAQVPSPIAFMQLVPADRQGRLISLEAELHYLAVKTERGRSLILYNLRDAVAELPADAGVQTHRAWWAAADAVTALHKRGRQGELELADGSRVPVSRRNYAEVEAWWQALGR